MLTTNWRCPLCDAKRYGIHDACTCHRSGPWPYVSYPPLREDDDPPAPLPPGTRVEGIVTFHEPPPVHPLDKEQA